MRRCRKANEHPGAADPKPDFTASRLGRVARYSKKHIGALEEFCTKAYGSFGWYREIHSRPIQAVSPRIEPAPFLHLRTSGTEIS